MGGVEEIEEIFQAPPFFLVIQIDGKKSQTGCWFPQKSQTSGDGFFQGIVVKQIKDQDQHNTLPVVIRMEEVSGSKPQGCGDKQQYLVF